jgi:cytochrome c oxidase subunit 1/cytochrome c oxidase subunit 3
MAQTHAASALPANPERATLEGKNKFLAFWVFLGAECVLFGCLFASFIALRNQVPDGPTGKELFDLTTVAWSTVLLLTSSLTSVFATMSMHKNKLGATQLWLAVTVLLGLGFLIMEINEFTHYVQEGHKFTTSAFGTSFYTLVGCHGAHVTFGICWITTLILQSFKKGLTVVTAPKFYVAGLYWHFIDLVWVFIFTVVYLMGKVGQ